MKPRLIVLTNLSVLAGLMARTALAQTPLGTDFTYQGQLKQSGATLNNTADFEFRLFNAASGGAQVGSTQPVSNVNVVNGLFTVTLNFGSSPYNGDKRWLDIAVRSPAGAGNFTTLTPRQPVTATPFALYALTGPGSGGPWVVNGNNVFNTNTGNVGIGTTSPTEKLHIAAPTAALVLQDSDNAAAGQLSFMSLRNSAGDESGVVGFVNPSNLDLFLWNERAGGGMHLGTENQARVSVAPTGDVGIGTTLPANRLSVAGNADVTGNVGIGTTTPAAKLDVRGDIRLGPTGQLRATGGEENLRIIRGSISANGNIISGSGFSASHPGSGNYLITFTTPFLTTPTVTASAEYNEGFLLRLALPDALSPGSANVKVLLQYQDNPELTDNAFHFVAVGPR